MNDRMIIETIYQYLSKKYINNVLILELDYYTVEEEFRTMSNQDIIISGFDPDVLVERGILIGKEIKFRLNNNTQFMYYELANIDEELQKRYIEATKILLGV